MLPAACSERRVPSSLPVGYIFLAARGQEQPRLMAHFSIDKLKIGSCSVLMVALATVSGDHSSKVPPKQASTTRKMCLQGIWS